MKTHVDPYRSNLRVAKQKWGAHLRESATLRRLSRELRLEIASGDLVLLHGHWYVTHAGLMRLAKRKKCSGIRVEIVDQFCDQALGRYVFKATVYNSPKRVGFVGYGDADPSNVSSQVRGAEMRVAETRAVNRALRKAYGIGICSVEELGAANNAGERSAEEPKHPSQSSNGNGWATGPRVRDRLCQLIRRHQLDADLVKAYAIDFCGVKTLREASREQVENFVQSLADWADKDRNALLCQLNSYFRVKESQQEKQEGAA